MSAITSMANSAISTKAKTLPPAHSGTAPEILTVDSNMADSQRASPDAAQVSAVSNSVPSSNPQAAVQTLKDSNLLEGKSKAFLALAKAQAKN